jgi:signal transduction histidine kinase
MNPEADQREPTPLRPLVLPYPALDIDDPNRARQAVEAAGCALRYPDGSDLCVGVGHNAFAGGYLYLVGSFRTGDLVAREPDMPDIDAVHRARIRVEMRGEVKAWIAPFERLSLRGEPLVRGRSPASRSAPIPRSRSRRGRCAISAAGCGKAPPAPRAGSCPTARGAWSMHSGCRWRLSAPRRSSAPARNGRRRTWTASASTCRCWRRGTRRRCSTAMRPGAVAPASLAAIAKVLQPGEVLAIQRQDAPRAAPLVIEGRDDSAGRSSPLILRLIDRLPVAARPGPVQARETITTPTGSFDVRLSGDARGIDQGLGVIATRMAWYVAAMLGAIVLAWLVIEVGLIRRIAVLTRRAAAVSHNVQRDAQGDARIGQLDVSDLRGKDELGILAGGLADLLERVKSDVQREQLRAQRERDMLQAVGHEILSPLQSLMVLHPDPDDPDHRYVQRMQQAVRVLYGQTSPSEALAAAQLELAPLDLDAFLQQVAANAGFAGIEDVRYASPGHPVRVRADPFSLEDVVTHILRNAQRHRSPGTPISLSLHEADGQARIGIHNVGPAIDDALLERIFDYGVSDADADAGTGRRGQGLFVARTYLAKMGGSVRALNSEQGVRFELGLPLER